MSIFLTYCLPSILTLAEKHLFQTFLTSREMDISEIDAPKLKRLQAGELCITNERSISSSLFEMFVTHFIIRLICPNNYSKQPEVVHYERMRQK